MASDDYSKIRNEAFYERSSGSKVETNMGTHIVTTTNGGDVFIKPYVNSLIGKKNFNYKQQIRDVLSATTPVTGTQKSYAIAQHPHAFSRVRKSFGPWLFTPSNSFEVVSNHQGFEYPVLSRVDANFSLPPELVTSSYNQAVNKLYSRLNSFASLAKVGEDLGEISQTINAFKRPLPSLRGLLVDSLSRAKHASRLNNLRGVAAALADTTLEWRWGWKPLCGSLANTIVSLQNREVMFNYRPFHATAFAVGGESREDIAPWTAGLSSSELTARATVTRFIKHTTTFKGVWAEECQIPERSVQQCLGLQARDVLPTIWNIIPWSCVIDYFINIGDIVASLSVPWGGVKWCCKTLIREDMSSANMWYTPSPSTPAPNFYTTDLFQAVPGVLSFKGKSFTRAVQDTKPLPELVLTSPLSLTSGQYLNLAALAASSLLSLTKVVSGLVAKHPSLPTRYLDELEKRGGNHPYPFHQQSR